MYTPNGTNIAHISSAGAHWFEPTTCRTMVTYRFRMQLQVKRCVHLRSVVARLGCDTCQFVNYYKKLTCIAVFLTLFIVFAALDSSGNDYAAGLAYMLG